ncbi:MAG: NAD(P)/FAD-dependent oxidoreductase [Bacteroidetes bacterium]|nr:MAG: NAD(P)/FAD-dependent oxidoreductase [Bacteroidota bacterium]
MEGYEELPMNNQASRSAYDVVVVGAGIGGLTSGALLAKEGKQVLVVEQEDQPGGLAREFQFGPYVINPAIHAITGCHSTGPRGPGIINAILNHLEVQNLCEFISIDPFYRVQFPGFQMDVPTGREAYLAAHLQHFPEEADGLHALVALCSTIFQELSRFPAVLRMRDWVLMPFRYPKIFRYANATLEKVVNSHLSSPRLKSIYSILYPYLALPPSRMSFLLWASMMANYIEEGAYYCRGGFRNFANALAEAISKHGGELVLEARVRKIRADNGKVRSIVLENGQEIIAPQIIANVDPRQVFQDLLEIDRFPNIYAGKLRKLEPSLSVLGLYLATDLDIHALGVPKVTVVSAWDLEDVFAAARKRDIAAMIVHVPTIVDETLAPPGENVVVIQAFAPSEAADLSGAARQKFAEKMLKQAEKALPGLRDKITFVAGSLERGHSELPLHKLETIYGWANTTNQAGPRRLAQKTPISGLYLAGHWTQPGHGIWTVVLSGISAARYVMGKDLSGPIWPLDF